MTPILRLSPAVNAAILKGLAIFSVLGGAAGLAAVAFVDWTMIRLHSDLVVTDAASADFLSAEARMMILLNAGVVIAVAVNLVAVWFMLRGRQGS
jgi:hypothetical protein